MIYMKTMKQKSSSWHPKQEVQVEIGARRTHSLESNLRDGRLYIWKLGFKMEVKIPILNWNWNLRKGSKTFSSSLCFCPILGLCRFSVNLFVRCVCQNNSFFFLQLSQRSSNELALISFLPYNLSIYFLLKLLTADDDDDVPQHFWTLT